MRRRWALLPAAPLLAALLLGAWPPAPAAAGFEGLRVEPDAYQAYPTFTVRWNQRTEHPVGYRYLNAPWDTGAHWHSPTNSLSISVPMLPDRTLPPLGEFIVELWEWPNGVDNPPGPSSFVVLRYDTSAPSPPQVSVPADWLSPHARVLVRIAPPAYVPPSKIFGYAVALSARPGEWPCAAPLRCGDFELDVAGGPGVQSIAIGPPPEGLAYVNVVAVSGTRIASPVASVPLWVDGSPPQIRFAGVPAGWATDPVTVTAIATDAAAGTEATDAGGPFTAIAVDDGTPIRALGGEAAATVAGDGVHTVSAWARDRLGNTTPDAERARTTVRIDETPPTAAFLPQRPHDPELIEVRVADALSGPSPERGTIGVRPAGTSQPFAPLPTQRTGTGLRARWSSDDYPPGDYEFRAVGFDAAGNRDASQRRADGTAMVLRNPVKQPTAIDAGFGGARLVWQRCRRLDSERRRCRRETVRDYGSRPARRVVPHGRPLRFGGVLRADSGAALANLPIEVVETFAAGAAQRERRTTVTSRGDGRFDVVLLPGPSRQVEARFAGTRTLTRSSGRAVTMAVRAGVRFHASTRAARIGGRPVVFSGRLFAGEARIPRTGRPIRLEFRVPGGRWSEFRTVQTDRHGRFRYRYAFTDDDSRGVRFQFRAVSPTQSDFPYRRAASAPVAVIGY